MRTKPEWYYDQSAALPHRFNAGKLEILIVTSRKKKRWIIPKGIIDDGLNAHESAAKEAFEEAGVEGKISDKTIGVYTYEKWGGTCSVQVFPLKVERVLDQWPESDSRERKWVSVEGAAELVDEPELKKIVLAFPGFVSSDLDGN